MRTIVVKSSHLSLQCLLSLLILMGTCPTLAGVDLSSVVPQSMKGAKEFTAQMKSDDHHRSFYSWFKGLSSSNFANSPTGKAIFGLVLFNNGYTHLGVEQLFQVSNPRKIDRRVAKAWRDIAPVYHDVWKSSLVKWKRSWQRVFPEMTAVSPLGNYHISSPKKIKALEKTRAHSRGEVRHWLTFQLASWAAVHNHTSYALKLVDQLLRSNTKVISKSRLYLLQGRMHYQDRQYLQAIASYEKVSRTSDFWIEALEERAWAHLRLDQYGAALSQLKTLLAPVFSPQVGPEPYFLAAFIHLKTCNYEGLFKTVKQFKKEHKTRSSQIQKLANTGANSATGRLLRVYSRRPLDWQYLGKDLADLPRLFDRDKFMIQHLESRRKYAQEAKALRNIYPFLKASNIDVLKRLVSRADHIVEKSTGKALNRLQALARPAVAEYSEILQKLQVAEAEAIHRLHGVKHVAKAGPLKKLDRDRYLTFPGSDEVWLDELDNYRVKTGHCPEKIAGRK